MEDEIKIVLLDYNDQIARVLTENQWYAVVEYEDEYGVHTEQAFQEDIILIDVIPIRRIE